jgi:hypothetical protein
VPLQMRGGNDQGLSSVEEDDSGGKLDSGEKISGELVVTGGNGAKVLELVEEALDKVTLARRGTAMPA